MKKLIFTLTLISALTLTVQQAYSNSTANHLFCNKTEDGGKKKEISIGSNRASGDMQLRFTAVKDGAVSITILNESGKVVLQQTNQVINSLNIIPLKNATCLAEGSYTVRLISNKETYTASFMIWK